MSVVKSSHNGMDGSEQHSEIYIAFKNRFGNLPKLLLIIAATGRLYTLSNLPDCSALEVISRKEVEKDLAMMYCGQNREGRTWSRTCAVIASSRRIWNNAILIPALQGNVLG